MSCLSNEVKKQGTKGAFSQRRTSQEGCADIHVYIQYCTLEKVVACMTLQMTWIGMQMRIASTTSSPTTSDVCGIGDLVELMIH